ncbi:FtsW/RodA/SpoVE family cell cycle protein [Glycomyces sp. TRM65418]|uniref:FtsW/RodA/SpoVE family cell cycle protein n=1 Tax=Glycomyces sp. TRM65418 TaxID=2867006 RepID=UPI001CE53C07|nr:FtsW/RodA/SpoVE family cell cycle protein [Glycomyces sp. TRM65418]QZD56533.1 FtsW/RodA/SpoVE family cell cycle protein [Glycomyces sp. TRM65418]
MAQPMSATARPAGPSETPLTPLSGMPKRIGTEIAMLIAAGVAVFLFQLTIDLALTETTTSVTFMLPILIFIVSMCAWTAVKVLAPYADPLFVPIAAFLTGVGIVYIRRIDRTAMTDDPLPADAGVFGGQGGRQLMYYMAAVVLLTVFLAVVRNHRMLRGYAYILLFAGIALAALPGFLPSSISESGGSKNWIRIGSFSVQPSEFAKLMLLIFFAVYLVRKRDMLSVAGKKILGLQLPRLKDLGPIVIVWAASLLMLVMERDLGTSLLLFSIFLSMLYMATRRASWILIGLAMFVGGCIAIYPFFGHLQTRVAIWLDPWKYVNDPVNDSYQLVQGLVALNSGGLLGNGPGAGNPNLIPASESDFILAAIGEEVGLIGLIAILLVYAILVERGFKTGIMSRDLFGKLMAGGLAFLVAFQLFVVFGGVTGLIPMTGQTTQFLAAGGSSLVGSWLLIGLLVRVSDDARKPWQASYGLQKTEAPPEFLAEQAARRAAEKAELAGVADSGPIPGGDQPTALIIPGHLQGPGSSTVEEDVLGATGPMSPPTGGSTGQPGGHTSPPGGSTGRPAHPGSPAGPQYSPPPPPNSAFGGPSSPPSPPLHSPPGNTTRPAPQSPPPPPDSAFGSPPRNGAPYNSRPRSSEDQRREGDS